MFCKPNPYTKMQLPSLIYFQCTYIDILKVYLQNSFFNHQFGSLKIYVRGIISIYWTAAFFIDMPFLLLPCIAISINHNFSTSKVMIWYVNQMLLHFMSFMTKKIQTISIEKFGIGSRMQYIFWCTWDAMQMTHK